MNDVRVHAPGYSAVRGACGRWRYPPTGIAPYVSDREGASPLGLRASSSQPGSSAHPEPQPDPEPGTTLTSPEPEVPPEPTLTTPEPEPSPGPEPRSSAPCGVREEEGLELRCTVLRT